MAFIRARNVVVLLSITVLVSLGAATQMADAYSTNGRIVGAGAVEVSGTFYQKADNNGVYFKVIFDGNRTDTSPINWDAAVAVGYRPINDALTVTNSDTSSRVVGYYYDDYSNPAFFSYSYKATSLDDGATTITFPAGKIGPKGIPANRNAELTYTFVYDSTVPVFATSTDTTDVTFGDTVPTLSTLCTDANIPTVTNDAGSTTFDAVGAKTVIYTCTDAAGNTATQSVSYSVAATPSTFNERASSSTSKTEVDGTIYHRASQVQVRFDFTGDGSGITHPDARSLVATNGVMSSHDSSGVNADNFYEIYRVDPSSDGTVTVTYPANFIIINGASNDAVTYTFVSDRTNPTFETSAAFGTVFGTVELAVGDDSPTLSTLQCSDTNISTTSALRSGSVNASLAGDYPVEYTCTDKANNSVTQTKLYRVLDEIPADTTNPAFAADADFSTVRLTVGDPSPPYLKVECVDQYRSYEFAYSTQRFNGARVHDLVIDTDVPGESRISYSCTDTSGNRIDGAKLYRVYSTAVPAVPTDISIAFDNDNTSFAKIGDTVTVTFDTEAGSTVRGTIVGNTADTIASVSGTVGTLKLTLDGDETPGVPLTFEFTQSNSNGSTETQTAVKGTGSGSSVTADFTAPAAPTNISIASNNNPIFLAKSGHTVTITFDTEALSTVAGTIGGKNTTFTFNGASSTLTRTLDGTETSGVLAFSFVQTDAAGNAAAPQTAVKGTGSTTFVTADFVAPVFATSTDTTDATPGDTVPTLSTLCTDANTTTVANDAGSTTFDAVGAKTVIYTCTDAAGNTATQSVSYSVVNVPSIFNERASSLTSKTEVDGTIYHRAPYVYVEFNFTGDGSGLAHLSSRSIVVTNGVMDDSYFGGVKVDNFYEIYRVDPSSDGTVTVTYPANFFTINGISNNAVMYAFVSDRTNPTFEIGADFSTVELTVGDDSPTLSTLQCSDTNISTTSALRSGSVNANLAGDYLVEYTCTDKAGNSITKTKTYSVLTDFTAPAVPTDISIASDNARDTSLAKIGDIVTITFDTEEGSTVKSTIGGGTATFTFNDTSSTLTRTLDGTETSGVLALSFVQTDAAGNIAATQTAVKGAGIGSSVTADFVAPVFATSTDTTDVTPGDTVPTLSTLCTDANTTTVANDAGSTTFDAEGAKTIIYTCTDAAGNAATQSVSYSVAAPHIFNERSTGAGVTVVDGINYHNGQHNGVYAQFIFDGDRSGSDGGSWDTSGFYTGRSATINNGGALGASVENRNNSTFFIVEFKAISLRQGTTTVTFSENVFTHMVSDVSNDEVSYSFIYDTIDPTFETSADFSTVELTVGDDSPTLSTLQCSDAYISTTSALRSGSVNASLAGDYPVEYTCTDKANNSVTQTKLYRVLDEIPADTTNPAFAADADFSTVRLTVGDPSPPYLKVECVDQYRSYEFAYSTQRFNGARVHDLVIDTDVPGESRISYSCTDTSGNRIDGAKLYRVYSTAVPAVPTDISIASDNDNTSFAKIGDTVTVTFDTEAGSTVRGTIVGNTADTIASVSGTVGTLKLTLDGDETPGVPLTFEFTQSNSNGSTETQTAVKGTGSGSSVTADFTAPAAPTNISIASNNNPTFLAKSGHTVTITFDTEALSTVAGTIGGKNTTFTFNGASSTLTRTLDGTETSGVLAFSFVQTDAAGNAAAPQTAVKGTGSTTFVTADLTPPAIPVFTNSTATVNSSPVILAGTTEADSEVILYKDGSPVDFITATSGTFEFAGVVLTEGSNSFTILAIDAALNISAKSDALVITLDTTAPAIPTNISIASDNADPTKAKSGDIVTITFETDEGSTVKGTIGGGTATFTFNGASSTLTRTLDGTETQGLLTFSFVQTDAVGNAAATQTAVKGAGSTTFVTAGLTPPAIPVFTNSTATVNSSPVILAGTTEADSDVILYKDGSPVDFITATSGTFEFAGVVLTEGSNSFTILAIDAALNISAKSDALVITLDTTAPAIPTNISIASDNADPTKAKSGDIVTITFETDEGSTVKGTIGGGTATFTFNGSSSILARTLDATETQGLLTFSFVQTDAVGNAAATQTAVKGAGSTTSVTADFVAPVFATSTDTTDVTFGDTVPTLSTLCTDANTTTVTNDAGSTTFDAVGAKTVIYTCTDVAGNTATQSVSYSVAAAA